MISCLLLLLLSSSILSVVAAFNLLGRCLGRILSRPRRRRLLLLGGGCRRRVSGGAAGGGAGLQRLHLLHLPGVLVQSQGVVADHERHERRLVALLLDGAGRLAHRHPHAALLVLRDLLAQ